MSELYLTSDQHFYHKNIIAYGRPFSSLEEMHEQIIARYNSVVSPDDTCMFLGDFCFGNFEKHKEIFDQLNGTKHIVLGNHDRSATSLSKLGFEVVYGPAFDITIEVAGQTAKLSHYPYAPPATGSDEDVRYLSRRKTDDGGWLLHGHRHSDKASRVRGRMIDVGVEAWDYFPVSLGELARIIGEHNV
jgi:calcineurin-like phosphoesterase family protein